MDSKPITIRLEEPVFKSTVFYVEGEADDAVAAITKKYKGLKLDILPHHCAETITLTYEGIDVPEYLVWVRKLESTPEGMATLAHEAVHVSQRIQQLVGSNCLETQAYLVDWVMQGILQKRKLLDA